MKRLIVLIGIILIIIGGGALWWNNGVKPANPNDKSQKIFLIHKGTAIRQIANNLKKEGLIKDPVVFFLLVKQMGLDNKIQAGDFRLSPSQSAEEIAKNLTVGTLDVWVTIPEGKRAEEIAAILKESIPAYDESWVERLVANEGYLFPDTYLIPRDADIDMITQILRGTFEEKYKTITNSTQLTEQQIVILASLIEREARYQEDRPLISSVLHNRLDSDMPLQIDATVQYVIGYTPQEKTWWKKGLTLDDLKIKSPYNTYVNPGLPPAPIANPGIDAIKAAANPTDSDYLFYITDKSGTNRYARTNDEHNTNIRKYGLSQ